MLDEPGQPDRGPDRRLTVWGAVAASVLLLLALASTLLPVEVRRGSWLPLHLALAGGAGLAIASVLPFFATSFAAAPPAPLGRRVAAIGLVASGALAAVIGYPTGYVGLASAGALAFAVGIGLVAWSAFGPLRRRRRRPTTSVMVAYAVALVDVAVGVGLMGDELAGWAPLVERAAGLRVAHAWLNLLGFASLVVAGTLVHLLPTVLGARIAADRLTDAAVGALVLGAPLVAVGMLGGFDAVARAGAAAAVLGAILLAIAATRAIRARGRWTTDTGWHRVIAVCLGSAVGWFVLATALAAGPLIVAGADPAAWSLARVGGPLVAGWIGLAMLGATTHLLPSIGPGSPERHAGQRVRLGLLATPRLAALELGVATLSLGLICDLGPVATGGLLLLGVGGGSTAALLVAAALLPDPRGVPRRG